MGIRYYKQNPYDKSQIVHRESNIVIVCDEEEIVGGYRTKHWDRYIFYPTERITEDIIRGTISGGFDLQLTEISDLETKMICDFLM